MSRVAHADVALQGEREQHHDAHAEAAVAEEELQVGVVERGDGMVPTAVLAVHQHAPGEGEGEEDRQQGGGGVAWKCVEWSSSTGNGVGGSIGFVRYTQKSGTSRQDYGP